MGIRSNYFAPLLAAGTIAAALAFAPIAAAATGQGTPDAGGSSQPVQSCVTLGGTQNQCQSPGNAQVYDAPPQVDYFPYAGGAT